MVRLSRADSIPPRLYATLSPVVSVAFFRVPAEGQLESIWGAPMGAGTPQKDVLRRSC